MIPRSNYSRDEKQRRENKIEHDVKLIIVDYLQLADAGRRFDSRVTEVSMISQGLKNLARELKVPVIALSQLSRAVEQRGSKKPQLSDLRESGPTSRTQTLWPSYTTRMTTRISLIKANDSLNSTSQNTETAQLVRSILCSVATELSSIALINPLFRF
ncbi:MAG: DnaB-like helicase C-terminal domain-containing protein [Saprospiraceae bacterium]|nr:DnaB-like helicase C-terminal domain-containing protein [Candidatus Brachybacter algidus]